MDASAPKRTHQEGYQPRGPCRSSRGGLIGFHDQERSRCDPPSTRHWWLVQGTSPPCWAADGLFGTREIQNPTQGASYRRHGTLWLPLAAALPVHARPCPSPAVPSLSYFQDLQGLPGSGRAAVVLLAAASGQLTHAAAPAEQAPAEGCSRERPGKWRLPVDRYSARVHFSRRNHRKHVFVVRMAFGHRPCGDAPNDCVAAYRRLLEVSNMLTGQTKQSVFTYPGAGSARTSILENGGAKFADRRRFPDSAVCAVIRSADFLAPTGFFTSGGGDRRGTVHLPPARPEPSVLRLPWPALSAADGRADGHWERAKGDESPALRRHLFWNPA